jgi:hypothetical protein
MKKYYTLSPQKYYNHGCADYAVFEDRGDGTAVCVETNSCTHRIHGTEHQYRQLGETVDITELIADRDYQREWED